MMSATQLLHVNQGGAEIAAKSATAGFVLGFWAFWRDLSCFEAGQLTRNEVSRFLHDLNHVLIVQHVVLADLLGLVLD
jgi:hypothetical protein